MPTIKNFLLLHNFAIDKAFAIEIMHNFLSVLVIKDKILKSVVE